MEIIDYTRELIPAVMEFERRLRAEEPFYNWDIDEAYQKRMAANDEAQRFYRAVEGAGIHDEGIWIDL